MIQRWMQPITHERKAEVIDELDEASSLVSTTSCW